MDTFAQSQEEAEKVYEAIRLPKRATAGSAGYDFFAPAEFTLKPGETVKIPTGIRGRNAAGMGAEMLSEKRTWVQIPSSAQQHRWYY